MMHFELHRIRTTHRRSVTHDDDDFSGRERGCRSVVALQPDSRRRSLRLVLEGEADLEANSALGRILDDAHTEAPTDYADITM